MKNYEISGSFLTTGLSRFLFLTLFLTTFVNTSAGQHYYAYVASESSDEVNLIHFTVGMTSNSTDGFSALSVQRIPVGVWPSEIEGPHGLTVSPDGKYWFVTMAHGNPFGTLYKYETGSNRLAGETTLGLFPATMIVSEATGLLYAANFDLHGDMKRGTISVVDPVSMTELVQVPTGIMPHGSRLSQDGLRHYSVSMMDGLLHEIDAETFVVTRSLQFGGSDGSRGDSTATHLGHQVPVQNDRMMHSDAKPTWVVSSPRSPFLYVALFGRDRIAEINADTWRVTRELSTGAGPYNLDISSDGGTLVVSYKKVGVTGILDVASGNEVARIKNSRGVTHGVVITPDNRFAFVSVEGVGAEPGAVDIIDLATQKLVASVDVGTQAGGISFWRQSDGPLKLRLKH